jgi:hypothetical protein
MYWPNSPFVIPVAAFAMVLGIVIVANIANYHTRKLKSEERLTAIAKGIPLLPDAEYDYAATANLAERNAAFGAQRARGLRTGGVVLVSVGVGLVLFSFCLEWILQERDVLAVAASGLIPLAIGIGLLVDYALRNRTAKAEGN